MSLSKPALGGGKGSSQLPAHLGNAFKPGRVGLSKVPGSRTRLQFPDIDEMLEPMDHSPIHDDDEEEEEESGLMLDLFGPPPSKQPSRTGKLEKSMQSCDDRNLERRGHKHPNRSAHHVSSHLGNAGRVGCSEVPSSRTRLRFGEIDEILEPMEEEESGLMLDLFGKPPPSKQPSAKGQPEKPQSTCSSDVWKLESGDQHKHPNRNAHHIAKSHSNSTRPKLEVQQAGVMERNGAKDNGVVFNLSMKPSSSGFEVQEPPPRPAKLYQSVGQKIIRKNQQQNTDMGLAKRQGQTTVAVNMTMSEAKKVRQEHQHSIVHPRRGAVAAPLGKSVGGNGHQPGSRASSEGPSIGVVNKESHPRRQVKHLASGGAVAGGAVVRCSTSQIRSNLQNYCKIGSRRAPVNPGAEQQRNKDDKGQASTSGPKSSARDPVNTKKEMVVVTGGGDVEGGRKRGVPVQQECGKRVRQESGEEKSTVQHQVVLEPGLSFSTMFGGYSDRIMRKLEKNYRRHRSSVMVSEGVLMTPYKFLKKICEAANARVMSQHYAFSVGNGDGVRRQYRTELFCGPFCGVAHSEDEQLSWELAAAHVLVRMGKQFPGMRESKSYGLYPGMRNSTIRVKTRMLCEAKGMSIPSCNSEDLWMDDRAKKTRPRFTCYVSTTLDDQSGKIIRGKCKSDSLKYGMQGAARNLFMNVIQEVPGRPDDVQMDDYYAIGHECPTLHEVRHLLPYAPFRNNGPWKQVYGVVSTDDALHDESDQSPYVLVPPGNKEFERTKEAWERAILSVI